MQINNTDPSQRMMFSKDQVVVMTQRCLIYLGFNTILLRIYETGKIKHLRLKVSVSVTHFISPGKKVGWFGFRLCAQIKLSEPTGCLLSVRLQCFTLNLCKYDTKQNTETFCQMAGCDQ